MVSRSVNHWLVGRLIVGGATLKACLHPTFPLLLTP